MQPDTNFQRLWGVHSVDIDRVKITGPLTCKVLIVEDDPHTLLVLREMLDDPDRNTAVAQSGEDALRCVLKNDLPSSRRM